MPTKRRKQSPLRGDHAAIRSAVNKVTKQYIGPGDARFIGWRVYDGVLHAVIEESAWAYILNGYVNTPSTRKAESALISTLHEIGYNVHMAGAVMLFFVPLAWEVVTV